MDPRIVRVTSLTVLGILMALVFRLAAQPISDPDAWWHLRLGDELADARLRWRAVDHWSSFATADWVPSAPLSDLTINVVEDVAGLAGVAWVFGACLVALVVALHVVHRRLTAELPALLATLLGIAGASDSFTPRPQVLSFVLLVVVLGAWFATEKDQRPRWWLVPLTWVWAMLHGYWLVGVVVGAAFAGGLVVQRRVRGRNALKVVSVPFLSLVVAALTPVGPRLLLAPLSVGERNTFVEEGRRTAFDRVQPWLVVLMVVVVLAVWAARRGGATLARVGLLLTSVVWLFASERTVAVAALQMAPLLALALGVLLEEATDTSLARTRPWPLVTTAVVTLTALAFVVPHTSSKPGHVPNEFSRQLDTLPEATTVLNFYDVGGWLAWRHPQLNVTADPLADAYPVEWLNRYGSALSAAPGWQDFVKLSGARIAILRPEHPLVGALEREGWLCLGSDEGYVLLNAPG